ncbi:hypothetical protein ACOSQ3_017062 [Xanthoceras sorbifolium]
METDEVFTFSARSVEQEMVDETAKYPISSFSSKRARSESVEQEKSKPVTPSFKSTLLNMANPKFLKGFGVAKEKLKLE